MRRRVGSESNPRRKENNHGSKKCENKNLKSQRIGADQAYSPWRTRSQPSQNIEKIGDELTSHPKREEEFHLLFKPSKGSGQG